MHPAVFLLGCIGARLGLAVLLVAQPSVPISTMALLLAAIGIGFLVIYFGRLRPRGIETGNKLIWWDYLRPIHGMLYLTAAWLLYSQQAKRLASNVLLVDVAIGLAAYLNKTRMRALQPPLKHR